MTKYNLLYNATILTNEFENGARRSGIFFVVKNIFITIPSILVIKPPIINIIVDLINLFFILKYMMNIL